MDNILHKEIWIEAPIQEVFACFTEEEAMLTWHGKEVELNAVPGGIYRVVFEDGTTILGEYKEIEINRRVVYTASYGNVNSTISVDFIEENQNTRIKLKQIFDKDQNTSSFDHGWDYFLGLLNELFVK